MRGIVSGRRIDHFINISFNCRSLTKSFSVCEIYNILGRRAGFSAHGITNRMRVTEMLDGSREKRPSASSKILGRIRTHIVGRVMTLASAIALHAILCVALLPLATRVLSAVDYGTYALLMSIVALGAAADGGAGLLLPAHYRTASSSERGGFSLASQCFPQPSRSPAGYS